ncbi:hypothetical protein NIBR502772_12045 [Pseudarthrobacter sp. NIBRBAC000502772]|uniref:hypothetical protein n=1 Tax=Pseudarthrobacter sp. NIBRBAC000502772 TaxID=2590775 RepID=UPI00112FD6F9|nr:hypothetical protein [Pseudarthrobacter sp. NIBRBAC000502772]QDG66835.1 hypothetical protein NIBR502772_12045 [Pseudarthrobacter sp. NIBRBAC000502772]
MARHAGKSTIALGGAVPLGRSAVGWLDDAGAGGVVEPSTKLEPSATSAAIQTEFAAKIPMGRWASTLSFEVGIDLFMMTC